MCSASQLLGLIQAGSQVTGLRVSEESVGVLS